MELIAPLLINCFPNSLSMHFQLWEFPKINLPYGLHNPCLIIFWKPHITFESTLVFHDSRVSPRVTISLLMFWKPALRTLRNVSILRVWTKNCKKFKILIFFDKTARKLNYFLEFSTSFFPFPFYLFSWKKTAFSYNKSFRFLA